jgi:cytoskeleton protein RodZ
MKARSLKAGSFDQGAVGSADHDLSPLGREPSVVMTHDQDQNQLNDYDEVEAAARADTLAGEPLASDLNISAHADPHHGVVLGDILRSAREASNLSLEHVADITRVRRSYLEAFETGALDLMPARPFAIGYVKAYAKALGLDEETMADLLKRDLADPAPTLRAPIGAAMDEVQPSYGRYVAGAIVVVGAVIIWNVLQRQPELFKARDETPTVTTQGWSQGVPIVRDGVVYVSKPGAPPMDQDVPVPYVTPGLEVGFAEIEAEKARNGTGTASPADSLQMRKAFNPKGAVFGAPPEQSSVVIQAKRSVNLVLRSNEGQVYFARQLGAGESYRVPNATAVPMLVDVSDATAFEVYYDGEYAGGLEGTSTPTARINARAQQTAKLMDAQQAEARPVAPPRPKIEKPRARPMPTEPIPYQPAQPVQAPPVQQPADQTIPY